MNTFKSEKIHLQGQTLIKKSTLRVLFLKQWLGQIKKQIGDNKMSSDFYTFAVQNIIKVTPSVNMVFIYLLYAASI